MVFKLIEVTTSEERVRAITSVAEELKVTDIQVGPSLGDGRRVIRLLAGEMDRQTYLTGCKRHSENQKTGGL
jgi:hypothetical protein